uniref:Uncharacterized protein n=1 Tax=Salmo trutta TaxID=8032 RepID=A0A674F497_SALTR
QAVTQQNVESVKRELILSAGTVHMKWVKQLLTSSMLCLIFIDADLKTFKQHSDSKHPKSPMVPVLVDVQA